VTIAGSQVWPVAIAAMRTTALLALTLVLIFLLLPAALAAAGPQVPVGG